MPVNLKEPAADKETETLSRFVALINQTNLVALDKTLQAIRSAPRSHAAAAARTSCIGERMLRARYEVSLYIGRD